MDRLCSKLVRLFEPAKEIDNKKDSSLPRNLSNFRTLQICDVL